jgi:hypothetical protein
MAGSTRRNRLAESRRRLTKLLIIAALIEYGLKIGDIDVGKVVQDDIDEAADLAKHGSVHVPTVVINVKQLDGFERYVLAWSNLSIETGVLDVLATLDSGEIIIGLPHDTEKRCIMIPSRIAKEFEGLNALTA